MKTRLAAAIALSVLSGLAAAQYRPITPPPQMERPSRPAETPAASTVEPVFKPEDVVIASGGPADEFRDDHAHTHAHLCDAHKCTKWCDWRETGQWPGYNRLKSAKAECSSYCMKGC